jgi:hypothetical protein
VHVDQQLLSLLRRQIRLHPVAFLLPPQIGVIDFFVWREFGILQRQRIRLLRIVDQRFELKLLSVVRVPDVDGGFIKRWTLDDQFEVSVRFDGGASVVKQAFDGDRMAGEPSAREEELEEGTFKPRIESVNVLNKLTS